MTHSNQYFCPNCQKRFSDETRAIFCTFCGFKLDSPQRESIHTAAALSTTSPSATLVPGHISLQDPIQFSIGPYQVLKSIGKGGMGEVFLAYDTTCGRRIALKRIRADLVDHVQLHRRFLKEARITSQLTHPAIIPIYAIHDDNNLVYYTMPYVEGETLKEILNAARQKEKLGENSDKNEGSITSLISIFLSVCQAVGYAHSKGVLHRDLKPENVIVGKYGEVLILDWGLAKLVPTTPQKTPQKTTQIKLEEDDSADNSITEEIESHPLHALTNLGKVVGTISYMAPERAIGNPATLQTDIYALGVILYQILTLHYPFQRKTLKEFRQKIHLEQLHDPALVAPYRDVPDLLSKIAQKALAKDPLMRFQSVDELLFDLKNYIEGRSEWSLTATLAIENKDDWEFQENVLLAEHVAITRGPEVSSWVSLMVSENSFDQNIKIETSVCIGNKGLGIGFLFNIPEAAERINLNDGYTLWLGADSAFPTKLLRSTVEIINAPEVTLKPNTWHFIRIENINNHISVYLDDQIQFSYHGLLPLVGTHIGLLSRDDDFEIAPLQVFIGGQNITLNCLAVPDAFLAHKDYQTALIEYRRIGNSFLGRAEGREALFRAGMTLLEQTKNTPQGPLKEKLYDDVFAEFEKLHKTPGAPLEYLGKSLAYQSLGEREEELKCFELALRRYPKHPLLTALKEQILYRMHESSSHERTTTYNFVLLVLRYMEEACKTSSVNKLLKSLEKHWEPLEFIEIDQVAKSDLQLRNLEFATKLAFWLAKSYTLLEICDDLIEKKAVGEILLKNALFCLIELGAWESAMEKMDSIKEKANPSSLCLLELLINSFKKGTVEAIEAFVTFDGKVSEKEHERAAIFLIQKALDENMPAVALEFSKHLDRKKFSPAGILQINTAKIWAHLQEKSWKKAENILHSYPLEALSNEMTLLHFLYGCWLFATEDKEIGSVHFSNTLETINPPSWTLFSQYYNGNITEDNENWQQRAFIWEKRQFYRQMALFQRCSGDDALSEHYYKKIKTTYLENGNNPH